MKRSAKLLCLLLAAILLLSLAGCEKAPDETTAPSGTNPSDSTTVYEVPVPDLSGGWFSGYDATFYSGYDGYLVGQQLYRVNDDYALCVLDLTTLEETLVCAKEDCTHHKAFCDAYFGHENHYLDGYLYRRNHDKKLIRCRLDGTERTELFTMGELDLGDRLYSNKWTYEFQITENAVYYVIQAEYGVNLGDFNFETRKMYAIVRFDMETGEEVLLGEFTGQTASIMAARDDQVLVFVREDVELDFDDPQWEEIQNKRAVSLQVWDAEYESFVTVKEGIQETFSPYKIEDGKILYTNYKEEKSYSYDPVTETDTVLEEQQEWTVFGGKYVIIYDYDTGSNYLALAETGEKVYNDFAHLKMRVCAHDDEGMVFETDKVVYPEGQDWGDVVATTTYYVRFADMEDGLQDYDCILLDHWEKEEK